MNYICEDILNNRIIIPLLFTYFNGSLALLSVVIITIDKFTESKWVRVKKICAFLEYTFLVLCFTVICRKKGELEQFFPTPFYDYGHRGTGIFLSEMLMNVLMFVPIGALLKISFNGIRWYHAMAVGFVMSLCIELLQWTFKCGSCETNDLINNTLGALMGYLISIRFLTCRKI